MTNFFSTVLIGLTAITLLFSAIYVIRIIYLQTKKIGIDSMAIIMGESTSILALCYVGLILNKHYSVDSFNEYYDIGPYYALSLGRYINCGINLLVTGLLGINQTESQCSLILLCVISLILLATVIACIFGRICSTNSFVVLSLIVISSCIGYANVFYMDLLLFPEMASPLLIANLSTAIIIWTFFEAINGVHYRINILLCGYFFWIVIGTYQAYLGVIEVYLIVIVLTKYKNDFWNLWKWVSVALGMGLLFSIINILNVKILVRLGLITDVGRGAKITIETLLGNSIELIKYWVRIIENADGLMFFGIMPIIFLVIIAINTYTIVDINDFRCKVSCILIFIGSIFLTAAPHLVEEYINLTPRSSCSIWNFISAYLLLGVIVLCKKYLSNRKIKSIYGIILSVIIFANVVISEDMAANVMVGNMADIKEAKIIALMIEEYENKSGIEVLNYSSCGDENVTVYNAECKYKNHELGGRIMNTPYSDYRLVNYVSGKNMNKVEMQQDIYEKFTTTNWDRFEPQNQIVFVGDTVCVGTY